MDKQYTLREEGLFQNGRLLRGRPLDCSTRDFSLDLLKTYYRGAEYRFNVVDEVGLSCLATAAACLAEDERWRNTPPEQRALVLATHSGSLLTDLAYQQSLDAGNRQSPRVFVQTLPNMAAGQLAACFTIRGEHFVLVQSAITDTAQNEVMDMCLAYGGATACLQVWMEHNELEKSVVMSVHYAEAKDQLPAAVALATSGRS